MAASSAAGDVAVQAPKPNATTRKMLLATPIGQRWCHIAAGKVSVKNLATSCQLRGRVPWTVAPALATSWDNRSVSSGSRSVVRAVDRCVAVRW